MILAGSCPGTRRKLNFAEARAGSPQWLVEVELFDVYRGKPLTKRQKSLGLRLTYRSEERTLTEEEVLPVHEEITQRLLKKFQGQLRA